MGATFDLWKSACLTWASKNFTPLTNRWMARCPVPSSIQMGVFDFYFRGNVSHAFSEIANSVGRPAEQAVIYCRSQVLSPEKISRSLTYLAILSEALRLARIGAIYVRHLQNILKTFWTPPSLQSVFFSLNILPELLYYTSTCVCVEQYLKRQTMIIALVPSTPPSGRHHMFVPPSCRESRKGR